MAKYRGGGMPNMKNMMKQVQKMQKQMEETQKKLEESIVTTTAGGGAIEIVINGKKEIQSVTIDPDILDPEEVDMLQDLIMVAVNDAISQVTKQSEEEMGKITGGMNIPGIL